MLINFTAEFFLFLIAFMKIINVNLDDNRIIRFRNDNTKFKLIIIFKLKLKNEFINLFIVKLV